MRAEAFLSAYRTLENLLERKYAASPTRHSSVVMEYLSDPESESVRVQLDACRELRNLLTHNVASDGSPIAEPSASAIDMLHDIIQHISKPQPAINFAVKADSLLCASPDDPVLPLMREMQSRGFSHAPILSRGRVTGVFSNHSLFTYILEKGPQALDESTLIRDFGRITRSSLQENSRYRLMRSDISCAAARAEFERFSAPGNRLFCIFLTQNGQADEPLLGMLTPWDVLREDRI